MGSARGPVRRLAHAGLARHGPLRAAGGPAGVSDGEPLV